MCPLYTIGYEGINTQTFVEKLEDKQISLVIDVREVPLSRKPGFSKNKLREILDSHNISYIHAPELGSPKAIRDQLHKDKDYFRFFQLYRLYIADKTDSIFDLLDNMCNERSCLLCFEHEASECHRSVLAEKFQLYSDYIDKVVNL